MKLSASVLVSAAAADWTQPSYSEVFIGIKQRKGGWGHPVVRGAADHSMCPALALPAGAESIECDQATCAVVCQPGWLADKTSGLKRRTKCRWNKKSGFFWKEAVINIIAYKNLYSLLFIGYALRSLATITS